MKDEVLEKVIAEDSTVIPRYDIVKPDGTKVAENVQIVLKNNILVAGTPLNKQSLLKDNTATAYGMNVTNALPDDVFLAIRRTASYCPKLKIVGLYSTVVYVQNTYTGAQSSYTISYTNEITVDILAYGTYKVWSVSNGVPSTAQYIDIDTTKTYTLNVSNFVTYVRITVEDEIGATIQARSSDGYVVTGVVGSDKKCTIPLFKTGNWYISGRFAECDSNTSTVSVTEAMKDTTTDKTLYWTKVDVNVEAGSAITLTKDGITRSGVSDISYMCTIWLPSAGNWSASATLGTKTATGTAYAVAYETYPLSLRYA